LVVVEQQEGRGCLSPSTSLVSAPQEATNNRPGSYDYGSHSSSILTKNKNNHNLESSTSCTILSSAVCWCGSE